MKRILLALVLLLATANPALATLNEVTARASYSGNGTTTSFAYSWRIIDDDDIKVIKVSAAGTATTQTKTTHYTVSGTGDSGGGNVVFVTAPASGETVVLLRTQPLLQSTDYSLTTPAETVERDFDKALMALQMHAEKLARALKFAEKSTQTNIDFPEPSTEKCVGWNTAATALENRDCLTTITGVATFTALSDTPDSYTSQALKLVRVNAGETALEFTTSLTSLALGSVSAPTISFTGDTNTGIYSSTADSVDMAVGGVRGFAVGLTAGVTVAEIRSTDPGATGATLKIIHESASPADNDNAALIQFHAKDDIGTTRVIGEIIGVFQDVTSTTMDSGMTFKVMNNVNAGNAATSASLSSLGVWTDASSARGKVYIGDIDGALDKAKALKTLGVYRGKNAPVHKHATAEQHYSPTAEEFYDVFGLGIHPSLSSYPGIAPKDVAWLAVKMALELDERLRALEQ